MTIGIVISIIICLGLAIAGALLVPGIAKTKRQKRMWLLIASLSTIGFHYSAILYHLLMQYISPESKSSALDFISCNPNYVFPIYPCNFVMWGCLLLALIKDENSRLFRIMVDFLFLFGIVSGIGGLFANGDYFSSMPKDYDIYKSVIAHGCMIFNCLMLKTLGYFKLDSLKNTIYCLIGIIAMAIDGAYCTIVAYVFGGEGMAKSWNSMFLLISPFDGLKIVRFHIVMPIFLGLLFIVLNIIEHLTVPNGERWYNHIGKTND